MKNLINFLLRANLSKAEHYDIRRNVIQENYRALLAYSIIAAFFFSFASTVALVAKIPNMLDKAPAYGTCALISFITLGLTIYAKDKRYYIIQGMSFLFYMMLLSFGLYVSLISSPSHLTVSLMAMYTLVPILFVIKPYQIFFLSGFVNILFLILCPQLKSADVVTLDMVDSFSFSTVGIVVGMFAVRQKYRQMIFERRVAQFSTKDQLTHNIRSMADIYICMYQINLDNDTFTAITTNDVITSKIEVSNEKFGKQIIKIMAESAVPEYLNGTLKFVDPTTLAERLRGKRSITHEFLGKNFGWCRARFIAVGPIGNEMIPNNVIFAVENINDQKNIETSLITKAETDAMTGLLNRQAGIEKIQQAIKNNKQGMLALFDVDKFKQINDTYGHQMGDEVIVAVARAMHETFRGEDILMRLGGDEYIFYAHGVTTEEKGIQIINRFFDVVSSIKFDKINNLNRRFLIANA